MFQTILAELKAMRDPDFLRKQLIHQNKDGVNLLLSAVINQNVDMVQAICETAKELSEIGQSMKRLFSGSSRPLHKSLNDRKPEITKPIVDLAASILSQEECKTLLNKKQKGQLSIIDIASHADKIILQPLLDKAKGRSETRAPS